MKIEKITKLKDNKYNINIEGDNITTYDEVILKYNILYKKDISDDLYQKIIDETSHYDIYHKTLKYALKKIRCIKEIRDYLDKEDIQEDDKKSITNKLINLKIVDDQMYVKAYINDKLLLSNDGINKIRNHLIRCEIDDDIINNELSKIDSNTINNKLIKLVQKKIKINHKYSNKELKKRITNDMVNLGYDREQVLTIIDNYLVDDYQYLIKEYHKLYTKLSKKYQGSDLIYHLKNKLYIKGFQYETIKKEDLI